MVWCPTPALHWCLPCQTTMTARHSTILRRLPPQMQGGWWINALAHCTIWRHYCSPGKNYRVRVDLFFFSLIFVFFNFIFSRRKQVVFLTAVTKILSLSFVFLFIFCVFPQSHEDSNFFPFRVFFFFLFLMFFHMQCYNRSQPKNIDRGWYWVGRNTIQCSVTGHTWQFHYRIWSEVIKMNLGAGRVIAEENGEQPWHISFQQINWSSTQVSSFWWH